MADHQGLITGPETVKHGRKEKSLRHTHMRNKMRVMLCVHDRNNTEYHRYCCYYHTATFNNGGGNTHMHTYKRQTLIKEWELQRVISQRHSRKELKYPPQPMSMDLNYNLFSIVLDGYFCISVDISSVFPMLCSSVPATILSILFDPSLMLF